MPAQCPTVCVMLKSREWLGFPNHKMTMPLRIQTTAATLLILTCLNVSAQDFSWDSGGGDTKYETAANWDMNVVPFSAGKNTMMLEVSDGGTVTFDRNSGRQVIDLLNLNNGSILNMTGGEFVHSRSGNNVRSSIGISGTGTATVNQSGGVMSIGHMLRLGDKKASGTYNLSGGSLVIYRGGNSLIGAQNGASISLGSKDSIASFNISGGSLVTRGGIELDTKATFKVLGAAASGIEFGNHKATEHGFWYQKGTLSIGIGANGVTPILVAAGDSGEQSVEFFSGAELDLSFHGAEPFNGTWTLLELEGADIVDHGLVLSEATKVNAGWSFKIDNSGPNARLTATYKHYVSIPEPMSYSMILGCSLVLSVLLRRRR